MKPGMLFALNRRLCVHLPVEAGYRYAPSLTALKPDHCQFRESSPVVPVLVAKRAVGSATKHGRISKVKQGLLYASLLAALVAANTCVFGFEEVSRARERYQLGRAIAAREQAMHQLVLANRQLAGALALNAATPEARPVAQFVSLYPPALPHGAQHLAAGQPAPRVPQRVATSAVGRTDSPRRLVASLPSAHFRGATPPVGAGGPKT